MGEMEASEDGTTSLSKTSVETVVAALLEGRRDSVCVAGSRFDIAVDHLQDNDSIYFSVSQHWLQIINDKITSVTVYKIRNNKITKTKQKGVLLGYVENAGIIKQIHSDCFPGNKKRTTEKM